MSSAAGPHRTNPGESGGAGILGMIFSLIAILVIAYLMMKSNGMLGGGRSEDGTDPRDQAVVVAALMELRSVKMGLEMRARMPEGSLPRSEEVESLDDLRRFLADYLPLAPEPSFTFQSYVSTHPDSFLLVVRARDSVGSILQVTGNGAPRRAGG